MADIATIFYWQPSEMFGFSLEELAMWHQKAYERSQTDEANSGHSDE